MKKILLIISCMVIVLLAQVPAAQETEKWSDKQIEELSKKFFRTRVLMEKNLCTDHSAGQ